MYELVIVGAGGCGREVYEMAQESFSPEEYHIKGFLSDITTVLDDYPEVKAKAPVLDTIDGYAIQPEDRFLLAIGDVAGHRQVAQRMLSRGAVFVSLIHPSAKIFPSAKIGQGAIVYPFVFVGSQACIGDFCLLNVSATCGHDAAVGDFSVLCPFAAVLGFAAVGENGFLATHAVVAPKKHLGSNVTVSANSAAMRHAPDGAFVLGVPGKNM